jgi:hypothetical protein
MAAKAAEKRRDTLFSMLAAASETGVEIIAKSGAARILPARPLRWIVF